MSTQPTPTELNVQEIVDQYLIAGRQANIDLAIEKGWDMESGAPSYICTDVKAAERVRRIRAELDGLSPAQSKLAEKKVSEAIASMPPPKIMSRGI